MIDTKGFSENGQIINILKEFSCTNYLIQALMKLIVLEGMMILSESDFLYLTH